MKKLNKIKLNDFQEMNDFEMKNVLGGSGSTECKKMACKTSGDCPGNMFCATIGGGGINGCYGKYCM